ncbi:MAG TPA: aminoglycoside phosphotransferase family protein [Pseudonocardiaceae bacterium]|nr:aminoglycoside phosphotransferase family protein [Pseudonocardiaceae bacterium]
MTFAVPQGYLDQFDEQDLAERGDWLAALPANARDYARRWDLRPDGPALYGWVGVVWPVLRADGTPAMLKLSWPHPEAAGEAAALTTWAGHGTVRVFEHDDYVLLLERLDPHRSLNEQPLAEAVDLAAQVLRRLTVPAPPLDRVLIEVAATYADELPGQNAALGHPVDQKMLDEAVDHCRTLGPAAGSLLVNEDLHYFNVLRGAREPWLLIDPKPIAGDPEFAVIPLLWNRYEESGGPQGVPDRTARIVEVAGLDPDKARAWTLVRAVRNWLGALEYSGFPYAETLAGIATATHG